MDSAHVGKWAIGTAVVLDYDSLELVETQTITQKVKFPYIPTLFSFRELPVVAACIRKLKSQTDIFLVYGHGKAHPYGCGLACHLGVALRKPTVGVAKRRLIGVPTEIGQNALLKQKGEIVAAVLQTQRRKIHLREHWKYGFAGHRRENRKALITQFSGS